MNVLVLAAETSESADPLQLILPATAELVYGAIAFLIVLVIMAMYAFPRLNDLLDERRASIQGRMEEAEDARQEAETERQRYREQLDDARGESNRLIEEAKQDAEQMRRDIVARAETEAEQIKSSARSDIEAERERLVSELRGEVAQVAVAIASKIVDRELDPAAHQDLVDDYIDRLSRQG